MKELFKFGGELTGRKNIAVGVAGAVILIFLWWGLYRTGWISEKILPNPVDVVKAVPVLIGEYHYFGNIWTTVSLNLSSFVLSLVLAILIGFPLAIYPGLKSAFVKPISAFRYLPIPMVSALIIAACGIGALSKVVYLALGIFVFLCPTVINKVSELQNPLNPDNLLLQTGKTLGMNNVQLFKHVYWKYVMSGIYNEIINLVSISYTYTVLAENINRASSVEGIGALSSVLTRMSYTPGVYCCIGTIIVIGIIQDMILRKLEIVFFPYRRK